MALIVGLIGVLVGWGITILSDWLPRYARFSRPKLQQRKSRQLVIWQILRGQRPYKWFLHAATELVTGIVFAIAFALYNTSSAFWVTILGMTVFTLIVVIDFKYRLILDVIIYPMTAIFLLVNIFLLHQNVLFVILGGAFAYSIFYATALLKSDLGRGDVNLALLIGITVGFPGVLWALLLGVGLGGIMAIYLITTGRGKRDTMIAYAPYLCFGVMVLLLLRPLFSTS